MLNLNNGVSLERQLFIGLLRQYRRPCYIGENVNIELVYKFIDDLIALYNIVWDQVPEGVCFDDIDIVKRELLGDVNYEIVTATKKGRLDFKYVVSKFKHNDSISKWETITASHALI